MPRFAFIALDADDTLWHNETYYTTSKGRFIALLKDYGEPAEIARRLDEIEVHNVAHYGYGIKSFTLSMIETALALSDSQISARIIAQILALGREMLQAQVPLFDGVEAVLADLTQRYALLLITKGDLLEQENKILRSGLAEYFHHIEIVRDKTPKTYRALLSRMATPPDRFLMVGNSLRSDIVPALEIGGAAVYIPYGTTWTHEHVSDFSAPAERYFELQTLSELPGLLAKIDPT